MKKKKVTLSRWDAVDHLKTDEDMAAYLQACMEEAINEPKMIATALRDIVHARVINQLAKDTGLTHEQLSKALSGDVAPSFATVLKIIKALGLKLAVQMV